MGLIAARRQLAEMGKVATEGWRRRTSACRTTEMRGASPSGQSDISAGLARSVCAGRNALCRHPESSLRCAAMAREIRVARHSHKWRVLVDFWPENAAGIGLVPSLTIGGAPL